MPNRLVSFIVLVLLSALCVRGNHPAYQVSIQAKLHPKSAPVHLCNGIIVHNRLVLTTAACTYYRLSAMGPVVNIPPQSLSILVGSDQLQFYVAEVKVHEGHDKATGANDVAILKLEQPLPLEEREDIKWIILDDDESDNGNCNAIFTPGYRQYTPILDSSDCFVDAVTMYTNKARRDDICSYYKPPPTNDCQDPESDLRDSSDRGTGLVCNSRLVGLLSAVAHTDNSDEINCNQPKVQRAFYTNVGNHFYWIYEEVLQEEQFTEYFIFSSPYQEPESSSLKGDKNSEDQTDYELVDPSILLPLPQPTESKIETSTVQSSNELISNTVESSTAMALPLHKPLDRFINRSSATKIHCSILFLALMLATLRSLFC